MRKHEGRKKYLAVLSLYYTWSVNMAETWCFSGIRITASRVLSLLADTMVVGWEIVTVAGPSPFIGPCRFEPYGLSTGPLDRLGLSISYVFDFTSHRSDRTYDLYGLRV